MEIKYDELAKKLGLPIEDVLKVVADVEARIGTEDGCKPDEISDAILACRMSMLETAKLLHDYAK